MRSSVLGITAFAVAALGSTTVTSQAAPTVSVPVIKGAKALSVTEKGGVDGMGNKAKKNKLPVPVDCAPPPPPDCPPPPPDCPPPPPPPPADCPPVDTKPGYGFGTTGHYGPPGQGFTPTNSWRGTVAGGGTTTPKGRALPPRAFR